MSVFVLMGVSGAGKTTIGQRAAAELDLTFIEGDDFHPLDNVKKMASGLPLTDEDREPWIDALAKAVNERRPRGDAIVACSALSRRVRERLRQQVREPLHYLVLTAPREIIQQRLDARGRHYMKPGMLGSQFAALEDPIQAVRIDVNRPLPQASRATVAAIERIRRKKGV